MLSRTSRPVLSNVLAFRRGERPCLVEGATCGSFIAPSGTDQRLKSDRAPQAVNRLQCLVTIVDNKPSDPLLTTSGTEPRGKAITGVPHAIASIMTKPNGSGQSMGNSKAAGMPLRDATTSSEAQPSPAAIPSSLFRSFPSGATLMFSSFDGQAPVIERYNHRTRRLCMVGEDHATSSSDRRAIECTKTGNVHSTISPTLNLWDRISLPYF
jgi:hypothetical protein